MEKEIKMLELELKYKDNTINYLLELLHQVIDSSSNYPSELENMKKEYEKQVQYIDFLHDQLDNTDILIGELSHKERVIMTRDIEIDSLRRQLKEQRERKWWNK